MTVKPWKGIDEIHEIHGGEMWSFCNNSSNISPFLWETLFHGRNDEHPRFLLLVKWMLYGSRFRQWINESTINQWTNQTIVVLFLMTYIFDMQIECILYHLIFPRQRRCLATVSLETTAGAAEAFVSCPSRWCHLQWLSGFGCGGFGHLMSSERFGFWWFLSKHANIYEALGIWRPKTSSEPGSNDRIAWRSVDQKATYRDQTTNDGIETRGYGLHKMGILTNKRWWPITKGETHQWNFEHWDSNIL